MRHTAILIGLMLAAPCAFAAPPSAVKTSAPSCTVRYTSPSAEVLRLIDKSDGFTFKNYAAVCGKLRNAGAKLLVLGQTSVLDNASIAWATVGIADSDGAEVFDWGGLTRQLDKSIGSEDVARKLLWASINEAVDEMDVDHAIEALRARRERIRAAAAP